MGSPPHSSIGNHGDFWGHPLTSPWGFLGSPHHPSIGNHWDPCGHPITPSIGIYRVAHRSPWVPVPPRPVPAFRVAPIPWLRKQRWVPEMKVWWRCFRTPISPRKDWAKRGRREEGEGADPIRSMGWHCGVAAAHLGGRWGQHFLLLLDLNARDGSRVEGVEETEAFHGYGGGQHQ